MHKPGITSEEVISALHLQTFQDFKPNTSVILGKALQMQFCWWNLVFHFILWGFCLLRKMINVLHFRKHHRGCLAAFEWGSFRTLWQMRICQCFTSRAKPFEDSFAGWIFTWFPDPGELQWHLAIVCWRRFQHWWSSWFCSFYLCSRELGGCRSWMAKSGKSQLPRMFASRYFELTEA